MRTDPDTFAVLEDLARPVRFYFDERISEQAGGSSLDEAVTVSPETGEVRVRHESRSLRVEVSGGFRPGLVYRVTLQPVVADLFGNSMRDPFELVFTTGGAPEATTLAGQVWDRVSGRGLGGALVVATGQDSLVHVARADNEGIFALRYIPDGSFQVTGFEDIDRDGEVGAREVQGSVSATVSAGDTLLVDVPVLTPDTTAASLTGASALDSVTIVLDFDDYLDPESDASAVGIDLGREGGPAPGVFRVLHEHEYAEYALAVQDSLARIDSIAAAATAAAAPDSGIAAPDSATSDVDAAASPDSLPDGAAGAAAPDTTQPPRGAGGRGRAAPQSTGTRRRGPPALPGRAGGGRGGASLTTVPGRLLPAQRLVGLLDAPLAEGGEYTVRVGSVVNINGLPGGGGESTLLLEVEAPPDASASDLLSAPTDSLAAPLEPDSTAAPGAGGGVP